MPNHLNAIFSWRNYTYTKKRKYTERHKEGLNRSDEQENGEQRNTECTLLETHTSNSKRRRDIIINILLKTEAG